MMGFRLPDIVEQLGLLQTRSKSMYRACKFLAEIVPRFVEMKKSEPNNQAKIETKDWTELARAVHKIALDKRFAAFDRRRQVTDLVVKELRITANFAERSTTGSSISHPRNDACSTWNSDPLRVS